MKQLTFSVFAALCFLALHFSPAELDSFKVAPISSASRGLFLDLTLWLLEVLTLSLLHPAQLGFSGPAHFNESLLCPIKTL